MTLNSGGRLDEVIPILFNGSADYTLDATLTVDPSNGSNHYGQIAAQVSGANYGACGIIFMNWATTSVLTYKGLDAVGPQTVCFSGPGKTVWQCSQPFNSPNSVVLWAGGYMSRGRNPAT